MRVIMTTQELFKWMTPILVPIVTCLLGVLIGARLTTGRENRRRRHEFVECQLRDFYSPILGLRAENLAIYSIHVKISQTSHKAWRSECAKLRETAKAEENLQRLSAERGPVFSRVFDYNNKQMADQVNGNYRRMVAIFREHLWLAEPETRGYFGRLLEYSDLSERWTSQTIPHEVLTKLEHSERDLIPFFEHIRDTHDRLRERLLAG